jgi:glycerophosphoryl diester phosphodiesterase
MIPALAFSSPVIAHRGARDVAPENTLAALRKAHELGAGWVEVDVKITQDGVPILMHDDTLNRTTNGQGAVAEAPWGRVKTLDAGSWFDASFANEPVPILDDVLRLALETGLRLNVELKPCPGRARATTMVALIEMAKIWPENVEPPLICSFDVESLSIAAQLQPPWPRGYIMPEWREDWYDTFKKVEAMAVSMDEKALTRERVAAFVRAEVPLLAYSLADPARAKELLSWGVAAVYADKPSAILAAL